MHGSKKYRVAPGEPFSWSRVNPDDRGTFGKEEDALGPTEEYIRRLDPLQERLYAEGAQALLIILQALDTGGKDGTIRHVMREINPQGCQVTSFKAPTLDETAHDYLWRVHKHVPAKGMIGIFNRSHYEDVLVTRVHGGLSPKKAAKRFREINDFERMLSHNGTTIVKLFLSISKDEQRRRLQARVDDPKKRWKFSPADISERRYWNRYPTVCAEAVAATSTKHAPWYVIPANHKWYRNYLVARVVAETLEAMNPQFPQFKSPSRIKIR